MMKIRRLSYFDYSKIKQLISYLSVDGNDRIAKSLIKEPIDLVNGIVPLCFKFRPESYIYIENDEILGLITISYTPGNAYKINITRLIFKENRYEIGKQLVEFVINKLEKKGALSFNVTVDESHDELLNLFINGCGFRQCSSEILWKIENIQLNDSKVSWRYALNSDSKLISTLYNDEIISMYKSALSRHPKEFCTPFFEGLSEYYKIRYLLMSGNSVLGYFSITTSDNLNYILDITPDSAYEIDYGDIVNLMLKEISNKKHKFFPFIKQKNYIKNHEKFGQYLDSKNYTPIQKSFILVRDYFKPEASPVSDWKVFMLGENQISRG